MRLNDVANQLRLVLPAFTNLISDYLSISSITVSGGVATIVTSAAHGLTTGTYAVFSGVGRKTPINAVSTPEGFIRNFQTSIDHDQTLNWYADPVDQLTLGKVRLGGFSSGLWNGLFDFHAIPNRRNFQIKSANALPALTGNEYVLEVEAGGMTGAFQTTVVNTTTFTIAGPFTDGTYTGGIISKMPRISVAVNGVDAWNRIITPIPEVTAGVPPISLVIIPLDVRTSKNRNESSDAIASQSSGQDFRLKILDGFSVLVIAPTNKELSAGKAIDVCRHDLRGPLYRALYGAVFPTGTTLTGEYRAIPINDGVVQYDRSKLVYSYEFQFPFDIANEDSVSPARTSAFRDIDYTLDQGDGLTITVDLDDDPLTS